MTNLRYAMFLPILLLGLACSYATAQTAACTTPPNGMVAWWTGDNTTADLLNTSNGLNSSPVSFTTGEVGAAFSFNGVQYTYMRIPDTPQLEAMTTAITLDAWVAASAPGTFKYIFSKGAGVRAVSYAASYALYTGSGGGMAFYVSSDGSHFVASPEAPSTLWNGKWHLVAGTFDGSTVRLYVDGQPVGSGTAAPPNFTIGYNLAANDAFIGTFDADLGFTFVGQVDELEVLDRALSPTEIQAIYNAGAAGKCKGPISIEGLGLGYWKNKNGQGTIASGTSTGKICDSGIWLRQYAPFRDLSATATCQQVASYVGSVLKGANASGPSMNAMLKAQMLATALDVFFNPLLGGATIQLSAASSAFGGATSLTVLQVLTFAGLQSNAGGVLWYGNVKSVQELAKDTFDAINNTSTFAP